VQQRAAVAVVVAIVLVVVADAVARRAQLAELALLDDRVAQVVGAGKVEPQAALVLIRRLPQLARPVADRAVDGVVVAAEVVVAVAAEERQAQVAALRLIPPVVLPRELAFRRSSLQQELDTATVSLEIHIGRALTAGCQQ
jgi:hypothetical protein